jgi:hypothetical protein
MRRLARTNKYYAVVKIEDPAKMPPWHDVSAMRICLSTATRVLRLKQFGNELLELLAVHGGSIYAACSPRLREMSSIMVSI